MDALQKGTLTLIRAAITGNTYPLPEGFQIEDAVDMIRRHKIIGLAYEGAVKCGIDKQCSAMKELFQHYYGDIIRHDRQMQMLKRLEDAFQANGIDYLPLKGTILKPLYPQPAARVMGDADILIRMEQYDKIKPVMEQLGFQEGEVTGHELHWSHPWFHIELHKMLMSQRNLDFKRYYGDGWSKAIPYNNCRYTYREEDHYIFLFVHYAKHYRAGGIGLRQLVDLWIYLRAYPNMDMAYIRTELTSLKLGEFFDNTQRMIAAWFEDGTLDEKSTLMSNYICSGGCWASQQNYQLAEMLKDEHLAGSRQKAKVLKFCRAIFPPVKSLKNRYPVLEKAPYLLPVFWPIRWITVLLFRRKNIQAAQSSMKARSAEKADAYLQELQYVGLDFDF